MKLRIIISYLGIPAIFATGGAFLHALRREPFSLEILSYQLIGGFLFYAAPYLLWTVIIAVSKPSNIVAHSGFIASTLALVLIASVWFSPPDPSGLPIQWTLYWPLAIILLFVVPGAVAVYVHVRKKAPNTALQSTPKSGAAEL